MRNLKTELVNFIREQARQANHGGFFREALVGCASAQDERFKQLPEIIGPHHRLPHDFLPQAGTVISFFIPFSQLVVKSNQGSPAAAEEWAQAYLSANSLIDQIGREFLALLPETGCRGASVKATHTFDPQTLLASWSHRSAACIAGLGRFGLNRMLITPLGGAGRLGTLFVTAELEPDGPLLTKEPCLYLAGGKCGYCVEKCPTQALAENDFDRKGCYRQLLGNGQALKRFGLCDVCGKCAVGPCGYRA